MNGSYCLVLRVGKDSLIRVGALGKLFFKKGFYAYVGSALNGIEQRVGRHLSSDKRMHWHIDYLTMNPDTSIVKVFFRESLDKEECFIAGLIKGDPVTGFGCSDCDCDSHLFRLSDYEFINDFMEEL